MTFQTASKTRVDGETVDAVDIYVGGRGGADARVGEKALRKVPCSELREAVPGLIPVHFPEKLSSIVPAPPVVMPVTHASTVRPAAAMQPGAAPTLDPRVVQCEGEDGRSFVGALTPGVSLLQAALDQGADATYDCMEGSCGTCAVRVVSGARFLSAPTEAETDILGDRLDDGYRLACQAAAPRAPDLETTDRPRPAAEV